MNSRALFSSALCGLIVVSTVLFSPCDLFAQKKTITNLLLDGDWDTTSNPPNMSSIPTGYVGVGNAAPTSLLHVGVGDESIFALGVDPALILSRDILNSKFRMYLAGGGYAGKVLQFGRDNLGHDIALMGDVGIGTTSPNHLLHIGTGDESAIQLGDNPCLLLERSVAENLFRIQLVGGGYIGNVLQLGRDNQGHDIALMGNVGVGTTNPSTKLHVEGRVTTKSVEILGGSDLSERFHIQSGEKDTAPSAGMVVCIDSKNPGKLVLSSKAYDRTVAGIISGAGGVNTGMLMGQEGSNAHGDTPVALTGRVYCHADNSNGSIEPGDLLTTSDKAGYAMKVTDYSRAQGAILGKAMTSLEGDKGLILVLVTLQ